MRCLLAGILACCVLQRAAGQDSPVVETNLGRYRGHYLTSFAGRQIAAFNGIRYAQPPLKGKRFKESEIVGKHDGVYDATKDGDDCVQVVHAYNKYPPEEIQGKTMLGSEDCLFLNVYTPNVVKSDKSYPVMVFIHGGAFMLGSGASVLHGPQLLLDKDVVLVTINYRLGPFGFLAMDEDVLPGNVGLKDQSLALRWVKENIPSFGGDADSITIFGESAGATSVHMQLISPRNKGVIHRGISQSGSAETCWAFTARSNAKQIALKIALALDCPVQPEQLVTCLQEKTAQQIMDAAQSIKISKVKLDMLFKPVLETKDGGFITEKDFQAGSTLPWMTGVNSGEGVVMYGELAGIGDIHLSDFNSHYESFLPATFNYYEHPQAEKITKLIKQHYIGDNKFSTENIKQFVNMFSDGLFIHGQIKSARKHKGDTYLYLINHVGKRSLFSRLNLEKYNVGLPHGDELFFLFPIKKIYPKLEFDGKDSKVQKLLVQLWTNFAIHGDPTPEKKEPKWYESEGGKLFVTLNSDGINLSKNMYSTRVNFWDNLFDNIINNSEHVKDEL